MTTGCCLVEILSRTHVGGNLILPKALDLEVGQIAKMCQRRSLTHTHTHAHNQKCLTVQPLVQLE